MGVTITLLDGASFQLSHYYWLFSLWVDSCPELLGMWHVIQIIVSTAEKNYPLPNCAHDNCLISIMDVPQISLNATGCNFFCMAEFLDTSLHYMLVHVRCHFSRLSGKIKMIGYQQEVKTFIGIFPPYASDVVSQHNKIGGITYRVTLVCNVYLTSGLSDHLSTQQFVRYVFFMRLVGDNKPNQQIWNIIGNTNH